MISRIAIRIVALLGAAWFIGPACASTSQGTDSNTHWIECKTVADCPSSSPYACVGGHCVTGDSGTPTTGGPCPTGIAGNEPCDGTITQCWLGCVNGLRGQFVCSDGTWVAGKGVFPCGQGGGTGGSTLTHESGVAGGVAGGGAGAGGLGTGLAGAGGGSVGTGGAPLDAGRNEGGRADAGRCAPMDAHTGNLPCVNVVGYTWTGSDCTPVVCSCEGADCASMYQTDAECRSARAQCGVLPGISTACEKNSDCVLMNKTCCACGNLALSDVTAINVASQTAWLGSICSLPIPCPPCVPAPNPYQAECIAGQCTATNGLQYKQCLRSEDCEVRPVDCCACGTLTSRNEVTAVNSSSTQFPGCETVDCAPCSGVTLPPGLGSSCYLTGGFCVLTP
jgi:hypothetical protein